MNAEQKQLAFWSVLVCIFFGCIAAIIAIDNPESELSYGCAATALILAPFLAIRFRWFRIMLLFVLAFIILCMTGSNRKKKED